MFKITVTGDVFAIDKNHYAQGWSCRCCHEPIKDKSYYYDEQSHTVRSNLILDKTIRAAPYAFYITEKSICAQPPGNIVWAPGAMAAEFYYKDNIYEIKELINTKIPTEIELYLYNGLLTGVFGVLELFLSDAILCLVFTNREVYERAVVWMKKRNKLDNPDLDLAIQRYFTRDIVYHRFDLVKSIFKDVLQISLPDTKQLSSYLHKRNNIAHRFAFSNIDRMRMTEIDLDVLNKFILCCNEFVEKVMKKINNLYE